MLEQVEYETSSENDSNGLLRLPIVNLDPNPRFAKRNQRMAERIGIKLSLKNGLPKGAKFELQEDGVLVRYANWDIDKQPDYLMSYADLTFVDQLKTFFEDHDPEYSAFMIKKRNEPKILKDFD